MTTGITAPFTSWHNFLQVNTEFSKLQKIYSASRKIMSIFMIQTNGIEGRCKVKWSKQRSISRRWHPWRKYFSSSSTSSPTPLHWRAIISLTTKTRRGELGFHGIISMCGQLDSWEWRDYSTPEYFNVCLTRWIPENGEMNFEIRSGIPDNISACFSLYINFNRLLSQEKVTLKNVHFSGIPALCLSSTSETTMRKATSTNFMVSELPICCSSIENILTRQTRPVPTALQEGLYKWGNGEEEHPVEVDRYVSCYGLCDWRGMEETKNGIP